MSFPEVSLLVTIVLAFIGYGATYANNLAMARRRERLELVTRQLNDFYGPLYVASKAGEIAFNAFMLKMGRDATNVLDPNASHDTPIMKEWRR
ncbi:MAG: hypothetical protein ACU836_07245 [Gammaproteobacteria bacterium]